jgi:peptidoglycan/LPS O-acetylase OafA/YrhL
LIWRAITFPIAITFEDDQGVKAFSDCCRNDWPKSHCPIIPAQRSRFKRAVMIFLKKRPIALIMRSFQKPPSRMTSPLARPADNGQPNFDLLRLFFACLVVFFHSFLLARVAAPYTAKILALNPGALAVDGFFLISGYLITQSWLADPSAKRFLARRVLRLYPGFIVASLFSVFVVGPLGADPHAYFTRLDVLRFLQGLVLLHMPDTPPVFAGTTAQLVNGSMWTISFEFRCYLLALLFGLVGLFNQRYLLLVLTVAIGVAVGEYVPPVGVAHPQHVFFGVNALRVSDSIAWFAALFMVGSCYARFRDRIGFGPVRALVACGMFVALLMSDPVLLRPAVLLPGAYFLFAAASAPAWWRSRKADRRSDFSYGIYLYGWPVQKLLTWYWPGIGPWMIFVFTLLVSTAFAFLSWRWIEKPALTLKPGARSTVPRSCGREFKI